MRRNRHPGDEPIVRRRAVLPSHAVEIYRLGKLAGERQGEERYWQGYVDASADILGDEEQLGTGSKLPRRCAPRGLRPRLVPQAGSSTRELRGWWHR